MANKAITVSPGLKSTGWGPLSSALITIGTYLGGLTLAGLTLSLLTSVLGWSQTRTHNWLDMLNGRFALFVLGGVLTLLLLNFFLSRRHKTFKDLGWRGKPQWRDLVHVVAGYGIYIVVYTTTLIIVQALIPKLNTKQQQDLGFTNVQGLSHLIPVFIALVIIPPIVEESLFRGFLYTGLKSKLSKFPAAIVTSGLFAVAHLQAGSGQPLLWVAAIDTFILSIILIELKERTGGRLWAPAGLHMLKNLIAFSVLFIFHAT